mgnify:FL=1
MTYILSFIVAFGVGAIAGQILIPLLHRLLECGERLRSQNGLDAVHGPDVHQPDRRQRTATHARRKRGHRDFRLADRVKRLQIRGRGSEHQ